MPLRKNDPRQAARFYLGDCLEVMASLPESSVDLIVADPPYHRVKGEAWDRQWKTDADYLAWVGRLCEGWRRVLKPNGSLYVFASPRMAARVECKVGEYFEVLNHVVWRKPDCAGAEKGARGGLTRTYIYQTERIVFAEHFGADGHAEGESGYGAECDRLRGFVFEPILRYLAGEFETAALPRREADEFFGTANVCQYWLQPRGFIIPTAERWRGLQHLRPGHFRREYENLRREYEDLRRPFVVSADVPYTDVWDFPTVRSYPGKHPCEKPAALLRHVVTASSRPGAVVLDPFMGGGSLGAVCRDTGRRYIGIEMDPHWYAVATCRIAQATANGSLLKE